jgi:hypothetical protein
MATDYSIFKINEASENVQIEAIKNNDCFLIARIKNPSVNVQLEAVREYSWAIQYIKNPYPSIDILLFVCSQTNDAKLKGYCVDLLKEAKKEKGN